MTEQDMVREFHDKFGVECRETPGMPDWNVQYLRRKLIEEEFIEFGEGQSQQDLIGIADALADMLYVIYGAGLAYGIDLHRVFKAVHESNMTKLWPDGTVHRNDMGKVLKPPTYSPADIAGALGVSGDIANALKDVDREKE